MTQRSFDAWIEIRGVRYDIDSVEYSSDLATPLPANATTFVGTSSATASVVVSGAQHLQLHPLSFGQAPVLGASARLYVREMGGQPSVLLTGIIAKASSSGLTPNGRTTIEIVDLTENLHSAVTIPAGGAESSPEAGRQQIGVDAIAAVVHCLHACGFRVTPSPRPQAVWYSPMVGGIIPEIGAVSAWRRQAFEQRPADISDSPSGSTMPAFVDGPWGPTWSMPNSGAFIDATWPTVRPSDGLIVRFPTAYSGSVDWMFEGYFNMQGAGSGLQPVWTLLAQNDRLPANNDQWILSLSAAGQYRLVRRTETSTQTLLSGTAYANPAGFNYVGLAIRWNPTGVNNLQMRLQWQVNGGASYASTNIVTTVPFPLGSRPRMSFQLNSAIPMQHVSVSTDPFGGASLFTGFPADPRAVPLGQVQIERLGAYVSVIPNVHERDAWEVLQEICKVTGCSVSAGSSGTIQVRSLATNQAIVEAAPARTLYADVDLAADGDWVVETQAVRNAVRATVSQPSMRAWASGGERAPAFRWPEVVYVEAAPSGQTKVTTRTATAAAPVIVGSGTGYVFQSPQAFNPTQATLLGTPWVAMAPDSGGGDQGNGGVAGWGNFWYRQISATEIEVQLESFSSVALYTAYPSSWQTYPPISTGDSAKDNDYVSGSVAMEFWGWRYFNQADVTLTVSTASLLPDVIENILVLDDSEWRQDIDATLNLMNTILDSTAQIQATGTQLTLAQPDFGVVPGDAYTIYQSGGPKEGFDVGLSEVTARVQSVRHSVNAAGEASTDLTVVAAREWVQFWNPRITRAYRRRGVLSDDEARQATAQLTRFPIQTTDVFNAIGLVAVVDPKAGFAGFTDWRGIGVADASLGQAMVHEMWHAIDGRFRTALPGAEPYVDGSGSHRTLAAHPLATTAWQNLVATLPGSYGATNVREAIAEIGVAVCYERSGGANIDMGGYSGNPTTYLLTYAAAGNATVKANIVTLWRLFAYMPS